MGGPKITVVAIVLLLVGLLTGYLYWGRSGKQLAREREARQKLEARVGKGKK